MSFRDDRALAREVEYLRERLERLERMSNGNLLERCQHLPVFDWWWIAITLAASIFLFVWLLGLVE